MLAGQSNMLARGEPLALAPPPTPRLRLSRGAAAHRWPPTRSDPPGPQGGHRLGTRFGLGSGAEWRSARSRARRARPASPSGNRGSPPTTAASIGSAPRVDASPACSSRGARTTRRASLRPRASGRASRACWRGCGPTSARPPLPARHDRDARSRLLPRPGARARQQARPQPSGRPARADDRRANDELHGRARSRERRVVLPGQRLLASRDHALYRAHHAAARHRRRPADDPGARPPPRGLLTIPGRWLHRSLPLLACRGLPTGSMRSPELRAERSLQSE